MISDSNIQAAAQGIKWRVPPVHPEGRKFVAIAGAATFLSWLIAPTWITWPLIALTVWVALFVRDPQRAVPQDPRAIVAPADGLITLIESVPPPREMAGPWRR